MMLPWSRRWRWRSVSGVLLLGLAAGVIALALYSSFALARFAQAQVRRATFVYAAPQTLTPGVHVGAVDLAGTLARLKYVRTRGAPTEPGQIQRAPDRWEIHLRGFEGAPAQRIVLDIADDRIARVRRDGQDVSAVALEPEVLTSAGDRAGEDFRPVRLADVPLRLVSAVLAAEDHRFFEHHGLDPRGMLRAAWTNLRAGRVTQGGSTITQQLIKNRLLSPQRTFARKLNEAWLAALVEARYSKEEILAAYLNEIYLGQRGTLAVRGVGAAARAYFRKEVHQLTLAESALLAGMARAPNVYSPAANPERARERRDVVLARMHELGFIAEADRTAARREPVRVVATAAPGQPAPYFADQVRLELEQRFGDEAALAPGARVFTSVDLVLQRLAEAAVVRGLDRLETDTPRLRRPEPARRLQAALVALDPGTGAVRALVGGRDYQVSQFNRATHARRQPGSAFKPFVYLAALRPRGGPPALTAASLVEDEPITLAREDEQPWTPRNYGDRFEGRVTVRRALEQSLNAATVRVALAAGLPAVVETARELGLSAGLRPVPALALGALEVTPLDLARGYAPFANGGIRLAGAWTVHAVQGRDGPLAALDAAGPASVISPAEAYLLTSLLEGVVQSGTGARVRALGVTGAVAGKTGTSNDGRDAWFVGYTPGLLVAVWVGFDDNEPHGLSAADAAVPIWADFVRQALAAYPASEFTVPAGVVFADVDVTTGQLANRFCPTVARETFLADAVPGPCEEHGRFGDQVENWWNRFRHWLGR